MLPPLRTSADALARHALALLHQGGQRRGAGALGELVRVLVVGAHGHGDLGVAHLHDAVGALQDHRRAPRHRGRARPCRRPWCRRCWSPRPCRRQRRAHRPAPRSRPRPPPWSRGPGRRARRSRRRCPSRGRSAHRPCRAAARRGTVPAHRSPRRAPGRGGRTGPSTRPRSPASRIARLARGIEIVAGLDQLGAEGPHGGVLLHRIAQRHDDGGGDARLGRRRGRCSGRDCRGWR